MFAKYIREEKVSLDDLRALISSLITYNADEIDKILKDKKDKPPVAIILFLKAIVADMKKGDLANWEKLASRTYGKPEKTVNHAIGEISPDTLEKLNTLFGKLPEKEPDEKKTRNPRNRSRTK